MRALSLVLVIAVAALAGMVAAVAVGIGCFHCGSAAIPYIAGTGVVVAGALGASGLAVRRRLLRSAAARRRAVALVAGGGTALVVALGLWAVLFNNAGGPPDTRFASAELAVPAAVEAGGRHRWPGTRVTVRTVDDTTVSVRRRWLGLPESEVTINRRDGAWVVFGPTMDGGWFAQVVLTCLVPSAAAGVAVTALLLRR